MFQRIWLIGMVLVLLVGCNSAEPTLIAQLIPTSEPAKNVTMQTCNNLSLEPLLASDCIASNSDDVRQFMNSYFPTDGSTSRSYVHRAMANFEVAWEFEKECPPGYDSDCEFVIVEYSLRKLGGGWNELYEFSFADDVLVSKFYRD